jgi:glyoxylase-like metal-dependent hydrolase (beta-lactamase superfamily II)
VRCHPKLVKRIRKILNDDDAVVALKSRERIVTGGGVGLRALFTPGHEVDHVCYYLREDRVMFTGDTVLGGSSTSVGDLAAYMKSLELIQKFKHDTVCPAHGPVVPAPRGANLVRWQYEHRLGRERQVMAALEKGIFEVTEITSDMYPKNLKKGLRPSAERNVNTHLQKLIKEETVEETPASFKLKS